VVSDSELAEIEAIRRVRNEVIHGVADHKTALTRSMIERLRAFIKLIQERLGADNGEEVYQALHLTASSVRSCVAPASGSR
jgi:hypothetical protein